MTALTCTARVVARWPNLAEDAALLEFMHRRLATAPAHQRDHVVAELLVSPTPPDVDTVQRACRAAALRDGAVDVHEAIARCRKVLA